MWKYTYLNWIKLRLQLMHPIGVYLLCLVQLVALGFSEERWHTYGTWINSNVIYSTHLTAGTVTDYPTKLYIHVKYTRVSLESYIHTGFVT